MKLLIANRGEIVARIARSARSLGWHTIALASAADRDAPHTRACDVAIDIGGERPAESYLDIGKIIGAAQRSGADAVHPGYGFLSENAGFARAVLAAGLHWVGPPPEAMQAMGDKASARRRMAAAGVPVLPGHDGPEQDLPTMQREAERIGLPLMIKASAGGGGRGMRRVEHAGELPAALAAAASVAQAAFGDARLLLERALDAPRHVEVQLLADATGRVLHLGERDCSVQRRHQKIIEEAPSPAVTPALRRALGEAAVRVAQAVGYVGAGTVEFLLEADGRFWFMEMNTRLQVEHALTEALTGLDLVEWQLRIALGEALPFTQDELLQRYEAGGHAIEARLCAEDPALDFLPGAGTLLRWRAPEGIRCDHALADGLRISPFYDSMLAKLVATGPTRGAAVARLAEALDRCACLGLPTNRAFLARLLRHRGFAEGAVTTAFIAEHFADAATRTCEPPSALQALAAAALVALPAIDLPPMWQGWTSSHVIDTAAAGWRLTGSPAEIVATRTDAVHRITALRRDGDRVHAVVDGRTWLADAVCDGTRWAWQAEGDEHVVVDTRLQPAAAAGTAAAGAVAAPMHGRVVQVLAEAGRAVQAGALLMVMEAMKMEHQLVAPVAGTVQAVHARVGEQVAARALLVEIA